MKVAVLGAGSWGTALAIEFARSGHEVLLWGRDPEVAATHRRRTAGIPAASQDFPIPPSVRGSSDLGEAFAFAETLLVSVPCASLRPLLALSPPSDGAGTAPGVDLQGDRARDAQAHDRDHGASAIPAAAVAALSGPTFAEGVARGDPTAAVVASRGRRVCAARLQSALSSPVFRLYSSEDVVGVELAGALKNVVAIAAGIVSGLGFGPEYARRPRDPRASPRSPGSCGPAAARTARSTGSPASAT